MTKAEEKAWQEQILQMRNTVQEVELKARFWKAEFEVKDFYLKNREVTEVYNKAYNEDLEKDKKAREELQKLMQDQKGAIEKLQRVQALQQENENEPTEDLSVKA